MVLQSGPSTLAAAIGDAGAPDSAVLAQLASGSTVGLTFAPALVGAFGTFTQAPTNSPLGTEVINIPPGDGRSGYYAMDFLLPDAVDAINLNGAANVDDFGMAFLNGTAITTLNGLNEFAGIGFSVGLPNLVVPGTNRLLISDANTGGGPSGAAFYVTVQYHAGSGALTDCPPCPP